MRINIAPAKESSKIQYTYEVCPYLLRRLLPLGNSQRPSNLQFPILLSAMYNNTRKRKRHSDYTNKRNHRQHDQEDNLFHRSHQREPEHNPVLFIQAHEADLRRGPQALELAKSLEAVEYIDIPTQGASSQVQRKIGSALIQWTGGNGPRNDPFSEDQEETISLGAQKTAKGGLAVRDESGVWVDR